jgi:hypothetical protein
MPRRASPAAAALPPGFVGGPRDEHFCSFYNAHSRTSTLHAKDAALLRPFVRVPRACRPPAAEPWHLRACGAEAEADAPRTPPVRTLPPPRPLPPPPPPREPALNAAEFLLLVDAGGACARLWCELEAGVNDLLAALRTFAPPGASARVVLFAHELRTVYAGPAAQAGPLPRPQRLRGPSAPLDALAVALRAAPRRRRVVILISGARSVAAAHAAALVALDAPPLRAARCFAASAALRASLLLSRLLAC